MRAEIKNAIMVVVIVAIAIGGIGSYFNSLDMSKTMPIQPNQIQSQDNSTLSNGKTSPTSTSVNILPPIDESHNFKAPDLVGISGYVNTNPEDLKNAMKK